MNRFRLGVALAAALAILAGASRVQASAEVHKFNLVISAIPGSIAGGDFNDQIDHFNQTRLLPRGLESIDKIGFGWQFDTEFRYFVRQNFATSFGVSQIHVQSKREFLPALQQDITIRYELLSVPIHAGGDYYFAPYNSGDFQARAYMGGGVIGSVGNKALVQQTEANTDSLTSLGGTSLRAAGRDSPGYYLEGGVHLFFASKISVMLGLMYRSLVIRNLVDRDTHLPVLNVEGKPFTLDVTGMGARMGVAIGF